MKCFPTFQLLSACKENIVAFVFIQDSPSIIQELVWTLKSCVDRLLFKTRRQHYRVDVFCDITKGKPAVSKGVLGKGIYK